MAALVERLDESFDRAVERIVGCRGRVVVTGMGKSGIICQKLAATFSSTGTPAFFMHPAEALHGDLGMIVAGDLLLVVISNSGETHEVVRLLELVRRLGAGIVALTGDPGSTLARHADVHSPRRGGPGGLQPGPGAHGLDLRTDGAGRCAGGGLLRDPRLQRRRTSPACIPAACWAASCGWCAA